MARVQPDEIVDHLSVEFTRALEDAVLAVMPQASFDRNTIFRAFKRAVYLRCSTWEDVPDEYVECD